MRTALADRDAGVRLSAAHAAGLNRDEEALASVLRLLNDEQPPVRREAATALGRIGKEAAVPALLATLRQPSDPFLEHALIYALIEIANRKATLAGLRDDSPRTRRGTLIALDQMAKGDLTPEIVTPLLDTNDVLLQDAALAVVSHRKWARQAEPLLAAWLSQNSVPPERRDVLGRALVALGKDERIQQLLARPLQGTRASPDLRVFLLDTMTRTPLSKLPACWSAALAASLKSADMRVLRQSLVTIRRFQVSELDAALRKLANDPKYLPDVRVAALGAQSARLPKLDRVLFDFLLSQLDKEVPPFVRLEAARVLAGAALDRDQLAALLAALAHTGNLETPQLLPAFTHAASLELGKMLVAASAGRLPWAA